MPHCGPTQHREFVAARPPVARPREPTLKATWTLQAPTDRAAITPERPAAVGVAPRSSRLACLRQG